MFGIGWAEFIFLAIAALLVLGPEKLPEAARQLGKWMGELRNISTQLRQEFQSEYSDVADESPFMSDFGSDDATDEDHLQRPRAGFGHVVRDDDESSIDSPDQEQPTS